MIEATRDERTPEPRAAEAPTPARRWARVDAWCVAALVLTSLLLWAPRLSGPMDLRYDAGVYYILGTSLAEGRGYRLLNEPGDPEAVQYPPALPALVAAHQLALGTSDPVVVGSWLRRTFCLMYALYGVACYALARRWLGPGLAFSAALIPLLHVFTFLLSDLLFAELPFALAGVLLVLVAERTRPDDERPRHLALAGLFGVVAVLLRTAGLALLAAWVLQALMQRRWRSAVARGLVALVPVIAWQAHVHRVHASDEWRAPAYEYQRAPYQFYNVTYGENVSLLDPFRPELGRATPGDVALRVVKNVPLMPASYGESVSGSESFWRRFVIRPQQVAFGRVLVPEGAGIVPLVVLGLLAAAGLALLACRGRWTPALYVAGSTALICSTPWPIQFTRYFTPLQPFLAIGLCVALLWLHAWTAGRGRPRLAHGVLAVALATVFGVLAFGVQSAFRYRHFEGATYQDGLRLGGPKVFYYDTHWSHYDAALDWVRANTAEDAVVAVVAPHCAYLRTGRPAIFPPYEADPVVAQRLMERVPISYVIVDSLGFLDITRRFALPAIEAHPDRWRLVFRIGDEVANTRVYERVTRPER